MPLPPGWGLWAQVGVRPPGTALRPARGHLPQRKPPLPPFSPCCWLSLGPTPWSLSPVCEPRPCSLLGAASSLDLQVGRGLSREGTSAFLSCSSIGAASAHPRGSPQGRPAATPALGVRDTRGPLAPLCANATLQSHGFLSSLGCPADSPARGLLGPAQKEDGGPVPAPLCCPAGRPSAPTVGCGDRSGSAVHRFWQGRGSLKGPG